jgi:uncharacterized protein
LHFLIYFLFLPHMILTEIHIYPIKGLGGISVTSAKVQLRGLEYDRRWMLVDESGRFISQRESTKMALLDTAIEPPFLKIFERKNPDRQILIPLMPEHISMPEIDVEVWGTHFKAKEMDQHISDWFSDILSMTVRMAYMSEDGQRITNPKYAPEGQRVSFADGYPFLIIGQSTLEELNSRLATPLPMNRFRPNFVFSGGTPYAEDQWRDFTIGEVPFKGVKPCGRCIVTTIDQQTGEKSAEPLKTLSSYRVKDNNVLFGMNLIWTGEQEQWVKVGEGLKMSV